MSSFSPFKFRNLVAATLFAAGVAQVAHADPIPYPNVGSYNPITYTFTAATTGDVVAYIVGGFGASYENKMGLLDNGVLTSAGFGLDNHSSALGQSFDLGQVTAGDTLTFVLHNLSLGQDAYSDPSMNVAYDLPGSALGHNHIYSTPYTATSPLFPGVPKGTYVAFEDLRFPGSDFNYNDESFVFTNVNSVPEPETCALLLAGLGVLGWVARRRGR
jgi:hypothetical protein